MCCNYHQLSLTKELTMTTTNQLIENHLPLADKLANWKCRVLPRTVYVEELKSAAYFGLVDAASKYEPDRGAFESYARVRIAGAMQDYLRELSWGARGAARGRVRLDDDPAAPVEPGAGELFALVTARLAPERRHVMQRYYLDGRTQQEVAAEVGLSKARVCQILGECREQIRAAWTEERLLEEAG
jgi:RNA polymerase sigma factor (sigma-70 family)